jgi:hypothetical protein
MFSIQVGLNGPTDVHLHSAPAYLVLVYQFILPPPFFFASANSELLQVSSLWTWDPSEFSQKDILGEGAHTANILVIFGALKYQ